MNTRRFAAHALLWGGLATMIGGLYMLAGTGWAAFVGGFMVYAVGSDLVRRGRDWNEALAIVAKLQAENSRLRAQCGMPNEAEAFTEAMISAVRASYN